MNGEKAPERRGEMDFLPLSWRHNWLPGVLLVVAIVAAYQRLWHAGVIWDDERYITAPDLRSWHGLAAFWTQPGVADHQYYPLLYSVFWVEYKLWGDSAAGYHAVNILLHAVSALLLLKILRQLKIPGAWLAAALFALHPVEVESVAWISELKNTLSGVFYLGAALAWLGFDRNRNRGNYALALGLFVLGLLTKSVAASLPAALLVVLWWQHGKLSWKRDVLPLLPFFTMGIGIGLFTAWVERDLLGAKGSEYNFSVIERILIAGRDIWFYLGKLVWPVDLSFVYPRWNVSQAVWWQYLFPGAALLLFAVLAWRRWRGPLAALLFFAGTLFPALGFVNVYPFRYSFVADHFQYLACLGPLVLAAAGIKIGLDRIETGKPFLQPALCAALLLTLGTLTWRQSGQYSDMESLWRATLAVNPGAFLAHNNLGTILRQSGRLDEAIAHYQEALKIVPDNESVRFNLARAFFQQGKADQAITQFEEALKIEPHDMEAQNNLAWLLATSPQASLRNGEKAVQLARQANELAGGKNPVILGTLAAALAESGKFDEAAQTAQRAIELARAVGRQDLEGALNTQLQRYKSGHPWHQ